MIAAGSMPVTLEVSIGVATAIGKAVGIVPSTGHAGAMTGMGACWRMDPGA